MKCIEAFAVTAKGDTVDISLMTKKKDTDYSKRTRILDTWGGVTGGWEQESFSIML